MTPIDALAGIIGVLAVLLILAWLALAHVILEQKKDQFRVRVLQAQVDQLIEDVNELRTRPAPLPDGALTARRRLDP